jgi:hypothetical protein
MTPSPGDPFLSAVPVFAQFGESVDGEHYVPVPDDWWVGLADVVQSTRAIEAGRYKAVNVAGVAAIAAMGNALGGRAFPFAFGGDGASFAVPPADAEIARTALPATATLVREELGLELRTALVPVAAIRAAGLDLTLAFFAASPDVTYAMFSGGGLAWAEEQMKAGIFALPPAPAGTRPDLTGLSCRFDPLESRRGVILSLIVRPVPGAEGGRYRSLIQAITALVESSPAMASPVPESGPNLHWPPQLQLERQLTGPGGRAGPLDWLSLLARRITAHAVFRLGIKVGGFDPAAYIGQLVANSDYRKYDDGLRMTIDCTAELAERIEAMLVEAERDGIAFHGLHRQASALMTCFTPSVQRRDHVHFVDGAAGGYATAAARMKRAAAGSVGTPPG